MKIATSSGASAVPTPSSALSTRIDESTVAGLNAAVNVLSAGTVKPKPTPSENVAHKRSTYATPSSCSKIALMTSRVIEITFASMPTR